MTFQTTNAERMYSKPCETAETTSNLASFFCELSDNELMRLRIELDDAINHRQDQIIILDLGGTHIPLETALVCVGKAYIPPSRVLVV